MKKNVTEKLHSTTGVFQIAENWKIKNYAQDPLVADWSKKIKKQRKCI